MTVARSRLSAEERRAAVLEVACQFFSRGSYHGVTTAEIARGAGVSEPILYRHFASKRDLYLACLTSAWTDCRAMWDAAVADEPDPAFWLAEMGRRYLEARDKRGAVATLWVQALTEASNDPEIRRFVKRHMKEVHGYVADVIRRSQEAGGILPDRDADAEAWIFISLGLLSTVGRRLGGIIDEAFPGIIASRRKWLTGRES